MTSRILGSIITPILLSLMLTAWNYVPMEMRRGDTYYSSFINHFAGGLTILLPLFLFVLFPLSLFIDISLLRGRGSFMKQAAAYGGAGVAFALLFTFLRGDSTNLIVLIRIMVDAVLVSWMYLFICRLFSRMLRDQLYKVTY